MHHWYNNINSQLDATIINFINNFNQLNIGWRDRNQQVAINLMFIVKLLSQHISGIIMPIIRRKRVCTTAYGVLHCNIQCRTPYAAVHTLVLLMMGIMMPETCWDKRFDNEHQISCILLVSLSSPYVHDARSQEPKKSAKHVSDDNFVSLFTVWRTAYSGDDIPLSSRVIFLFVFILMILKGATSGSVWSLKLDPAKNVPTVSSRLGNIPMDLLRLSHLHDRGLPFTRTWPWAIC